MPQAISRRLSNMFLKDKNSHWPVFGGTQKFQNSPHFRDNLLFFEYFHGNNGPGLGACHQTGWTGVVARMLQLFATTTSEQVQALGKVAGLVEVQKAPIGPLASTIKSGGK